MRTAMLVVLAVAAGATNALSFVALGRVFTSVITGNLVLIGVSIGSRSIFGLGGAAMACVAYAIAVAAHTRYVTGFTWSLLAVAALQASVLVGWLESTGSPTPAVQLALIAMCALAMGLQSAAVRKLPVSGVSTTYLTGTLTHLVANLVAGRRVHVTYLSVLPALLVGAVAETLLLHTAAAAAPALQLTLTIVALVCGRRVLD